MAHASRWPQLAAAFARLGLPVAVVDLESTGGNFYQDRITEVAVLRFERGAVKRYEWLVNPEQPISPFIENLTGISNAMVADAPTFAQIAPDLLPLLRGALVVAHNSRFDYTFLRHEFGRAGLDFATPALCSVQLSRRLYPQFYKHNLDSIIERFHIQVEHRHRAMTDVLALSDFLEHSLSDKDAQEWDNQCRSLMNPKMLPTWLPEVLAQQLYALPDRHGVLVWLDKFGQAQAVTAHERAYQETAALLHGKKVLHYAQSAAAVRFLPAVGSLHALWLKAQTIQEYHIMPSESLRTFTTVHFAADEHGALQARIVPLKNGSRNQRPYGFFLHKKAAKRALAAWAQEYGLCPDSLNILPDTHAKGVPCPVHAVGKCSGACQNSDGISRQNERVRQLAPLLPVSDWGRAHEIEITETDPLTGHSMTFYCAGGALVLPDGRWYFDDTLLALLKGKFKQGKEAVRIIA
ncbi:3'-5' exonuclease family protein [Neisseria perflava]|uniref:3'-5' exonuclease family protein n=1 Tax=Neisseria perflava TaxID=33053 RepID=UPI00209F046F|nr:3'-5' exonuclease family protein [Neisseria perflava]MCP1660680.1 DNA polymerase-3 subunit epsilon [Neisseria perflava]MCP1771872.1 DNA polymerase-3 subunit epsilon [Neisseria perflava]